MPAVYYSILYVCCILFSICSRHSTVYACYSYTYVLPIDEIKCGPTRTRSHHTCERLTHLVWVEGSVGCTVRYAQFTLHLRSLSGRGGVYIRVGKVHFIPSIIVGAGTGVY